MFKPKLRRRWSLYDAKGNRHRVSVNLIGEQPFMTQDWFELRIFYNLTWDQSIMFRYVIHSRFHITIYRDPLCAVRRPTHAAERFQCASFFASINKFFMAEVMVVN